MRGSRPMSVMTISARPRSVKAALTPIHPHLAVHYHMCVVTQLPHVMLLARTLRQGVPTSLSKCVFRGGRSLRSAPKSAVRDFSAIRFSCFADAAFACSCGTCFVATQRVSSFQPFMGAVSVGMLTRGALDVFNDLLARALRCLSHRPLLSGYDEQQTLSWQIALFGPIGADVRQN